MRIHEGYVDVRAKKLRGCKVVFDTPTVGGTENILMAAVTAEGETVIQNAAREPEVVDLATMLAKMGASIEGIGTETIRIKGVKELVPCDYEVIPDRIEAGTFLVGCGLTRGSIVLEDARADHLKALIGKLKEAGMEIEEKERR